MNEEWLQASGACLAAPEQTLPTLSDEDGGENLLGDQDGIETSERREKLNLLKCKRCRDARKKVWIEKFPGRERWLKITSAVRIAFGHKKVKSVFLKGWSLYVHVQSRH
jgi:hypothetical protein